MASVQVLSLLLRLMCTCGGWREVCLSKTLFKDSQIDATQLPTHAFGNYVAAALEIMFKPLA